MNIITYDMITKKIKKCVGDKGVVYTKLEGEEAKRNLAYLNLPFGCIFNSVGDLEEFRKATIDDSRELYHFSIVAADTKKKKEYIALCEDSKPLFLMSSNKTYGKNIVYSESSFMVYDDVTKKLETRVDSNLMMIGDTKILDVKFLDSRKDEYCKKDYKFYYENNNTMVAYQIGEDKFLIPDSKYENTSGRLTLAISTVEEVSEKIRRKTDEGLNANLDDVKEYKIKRKVG